ncbi:nucleotidyltransferase family protein [Paenibacillus jiagnxiensis]|uniref:nucleotidyltransferase family protein n=1 Tax=Paenibacillus jiagnxiensis TaxID=3228926 RepID=UPI0033A16B3C
MKHEELLYSYMDDPLVIEDLKRVRELGLPQGCIAAGYVRNRVWDKLHGYVALTPLNDIDVIYYDPGNTLEERDHHLQQLLNRGQINRHWSVKNQARMHERNGDPPYASAEDAMRYWPETATAVGIYMDVQDVMHTVAPFGLDDLFEMRVRKSPCFRNTTAFRIRVFQKEWLDTWPLLIMDQ